MEHFSRSLWYYKCLVVHTKYCPEKHLYLWYKDLILGVQNEFWMKFRMKYQRECFYLCIKLWQMLCCIYHSILWDHPFSACAYLPHPWSGDSQGQETFLAPSADKQTRNYDIECSNHHPSLSTLRPGADPAFVIRSGPNSELFLSDLRKLLKRDTFF